MFHKRSKNACGRSRHGDGFRRWLFRRGLSLASPLLAVCMTHAEEAGVGLAPPLRAPIRSATPTVSPLSISPEQAKSSIQWLTDVALRRVPTSYHGNKDWGQQKRLWAGVKVRFDQGKLKTKRRYREVNQGRWIKYQIDLPEHRPIQSTIEQVESLPPDEKFPSGAMGILSVTRVPMKFSARLQRWNLGVRLYSVTVEGRMDVQLKAQSTLAIHADYREVLPAMIVQPRVETANLKLVRFEVDRVSHVGGDAAEAWGEIMQEVIIERFVAKQSERLTLKINQAIEKHRDDLRLSLPSWLESWQ